MQNRKATHSDLDAILSVIDQGRAALAARGIDQWQDGYPDRAAIADDLRLGAGWVLEEAGEVVAYAAIRFDGEAAYDALEGQWLTSGPYVVVHRLAVAARHTRRGAARRMLHLAEELARERGVRAFRIDTHPQNARMLALLESEGFRYCGRCYYGAMRLAFEKVLSTR